MNDTITKPELIQTVVTERARFDEVLSHIPQKRMIQPGVLGHWSVKDVISHICWGEHKMVGLLHTHILTDAELWDLTKEERDAIIYDRNKERPLVEVRAEAHKLIQDMVAAIETLDEADLTDSARFKDIPAGLAPWQFIASNTYDHYRAHLHDIQAWLESLD